MATPVLVRSHESGGALSFSPLMANGKSVQALPPVSSYTFAHILKSADSADFQHAIDGIAEICAKTRLSLADEYSSHLPPLGEITAANSATSRPHLLRPGMRRALTSVPEASSGSSEGSRKSKKKSRTTGLFGFGRREEAKTHSMRSMRIGSMGRTIAVNGTTAMASHLSDDDAMDPSERPTRPMPQRTPSEALSSLQRLLAQTRRDTNDGG